MLSDLAWIYGGVLAGVWGAYGARRAHIRRRGLRVRASAERAGMLDPSSRHPAIDVRRCLGCGACVAACPEGEVLAVIDGRATLLNPSACVGHAHCKDTCPTDAIKLVYGSARRGVDIPLLGEDLETNVPGIFIAGELGGVGLIANAVQQGRRAVAGIESRRRTDIRDALDVVIAGAGPAGLAASLAAMEQGLRFVTVEQDSLGGCIAHYPRGKLVMSRPVELPIVGSMPFPTATKRDLLEYWHDVERRTGLEIRYGERLSRVSRRDLVFEVTTANATYTTRAILLAIGRRGTPRRLGVPGENLPKVTYHLVDPQQYRQRHVLVVGGGDSAIEAAITLAETAGAAVTLSYRGSSFFRAKQNNRDRLSIAEAAGRIRVLRRSQVREIGRQAVLISCDAGNLSVPNDDVILCTGGTFPFDLLHEIGISVETKYGTA